MWLKFVLAAAATSHDRNTNRTSVFEIVERLRPVNLPAILPRLSVAVGLVFEEGELKKECSIEIKLNSPGAPQGRVQMKITPSARLHTLVPTFANVPIATSGDFTVNIFFNGNEIGRTLIIVDPADETRNPDPLLFNTKPSAIKLVTGEQQKTEQSNAL